MTGSHPAEEPHDLVQSVSRALRVLEEVTRSKGPITVKALARRTELNLSTTYHLVRTLAYEGYLLRQQDGRYDVGPEVPRRFRDLRTTMDRPPDAHRVLSHLASTTHRSAYLAGFVGDRIMITDLVEGSASPYLEDIEVGLEAAAHATALGKALLATLPTARRRRYLAEQGMRPFTRRTTVDVDALEHELATAGPGRVVLDRGHFRDEVTCAATLVGRGAGQASWWAVAVSERGEEITDDVISHLFRAAKDLTVS